MENALNQLNSYQSLESDEMFGVDGGLALTKGALIAGGIIIVGVSTGLAIAWATRN